eukprot:GHVS01065042.1.p1 GENE.GHVS01065042.1~~GHVS01065042.1.p1  ORF type:complete len:277 (+),score=51.60 GHVS01065042.1:78-833(+)
MVPSLLPGGHRGLSRGILRQPCGFVPLFGTNVVVRGGGGGGEDFPSWSVGVGSRFRRSASSAVASHHPAFSLVKEEDVKEYSARVTEYVHNRTGAKMVSWSTPKQDPEKVFCVCLQTRVEDSTGLPHVMEHSVLCGSEKYPMKEPFAELLKGSLYSFLNAFTYPDRTCYPVASVNDKDFYNLADVYMDALLRPRAVKDEQVLQQEGWHFGCDEKGKLRRSGVVYNEMKGVYSSPDALMGRYTLQVDSSSCR